MSQKNKERKRSSENTHFYGKDTKRHRCEQIHAISTRSKSTRSANAKRGLQNTKRRSQDTNSNPRKRQRRQPRGKDVGIVGVRHLLRGNKTKYEATVSPVAILLAQTGDAKNPQRPLVALLDSGTTSCIAIGDRVPFLRPRKSKSTNWSTKAGSFQTKGVGKLTFVMPEFTTKPKFEFQIHIDDRPASGMQRYDIILGTNFLKAFGINLRFDEKVIEYEGATIPMRFRDGLDDNIHTLTVCLLFHVDDEKEINEPVDKNLMMSNALQFRNYEMRWSVHLQ